MKTSIIPIALAAASLVSRANESSSAAKPNVSFILSDDLGYMDIGANNPKTFYETPNISFIDLKVADSKGNRCYTANEILTVKVSGAARLGGASEMEVSGGLARIAIRSTGETGDVKVIAKGKGLKDGELTVKSLLE